MSRLESSLETWLPDHMSETGVIWAIAEECPSRECTVYSSFHVHESETNAHVVAGIRTRKGADECFCRLESDWVGFGRKNSS